MYLFAWAQVIYKIPIHVYKRSNQANFAKGGSIIMTPFSIYHYHKRMPRLNETLSPSRNICGLNEASSLLTEIEKVRSEMPPEAGQK